MRTHIASSSNLFLLPMLFLLGFNVQAQYTDYDKLEAIAKEKFSDDQFMVLESKEVYRFYRSKNEESPIKAEMKATIDIVNTKDKAVVYMETTNMHNSVVAVTGNRFDSKKNKMISCSVKNESFKYESGGIFHNDFYLNPLSTYEKEKGIYQISYEKQYSDFKFLAYIPMTPHKTTNKSSVVIEVPSWLEIEFVEMNLDRYEIQKEVVPGEKFTTYKYNWDDVPFIEDYVYSASAKHYSPHLVVVYKNSIKKSGEKIPLMPDTKSQYSWYHELVAAIPDNADEISKLSDQFVEMPMGKSQLEAVDKWIRENVRYIAFESGIAGFQPDACQKVYNNRYGDCKGMANLFKNTALALGYDARLAWIGTRKEVPYSYDIPSLLVDNHMIATVIYEGDTIFVDPTETYGRSDELAFRIQGRPVLIENGSDYIVTHVPESTLESDRVLRNLQVTFDMENHTSNYKISSSFDGEPKKDILSGFYSVRGQYKEEALEDYLRPNDQASLNLISSKGLVDSAHTVSFEYEYSTSVDVINVGAEFYLDLDPTHDLEGIELKETRYAEWFFNQRYSRETTIEFEVPEGYKINYHPVPFQASNEDFEISIVISEENSTLTVSKTIKILNGVVQSKNQAEFESALSLLKAYYEDTIIIQSI